MKSFRQFDGGAKKRESTMTYDPFDRPVEQNETATGALPRTTLSSYLGLSDDVGSEERLEGADATGTLKETKSYSYDAFGRRMSMNDKMAAGQAGKDFEYAEDAHGNVSLLLDDAGKAQASYGYSAYGEANEEMTQERDAGDSTKVLDQKSASTNPLNQYRYSAKRMDPSSGTLDMGARRFGPGTSRFLQEDIYSDALGDLGLATDPLTQNRYSLAGGNPVSFIEIDGHEPGPSYTDRRAVNRPYVRRARSSRRQQSSQTPDSYDRSNRPAPQQQVDKTYVKAETQRTNMNRLRRIERGGVKEDNSLLNPINLATTVGTGGASVPVRAGGRKVIQGLKSGIGKIRGGGATKSPIRLPAFTESSVDEALTSSARLGKGGQIQEGARAVAKKQGQGASPFEGLPQTQAQAESIIDDVLRNPTVVDRGDRVIDAYNAAGQGVRLRRDTRAFQGFLDLGRRSPR